MFILHKLFAGIHKHGWMTFVLLSLISFILSVFAFISMSESHHFEWGMLLQALALSFEGLPDNYNVFVFVAKIFWMLTFASVAFSLFLRNWSHQQLFKSIQEERHIAIVGLSALSHNYINDLDNDTTLILNTNSANISSDVLKENGFAIKDVEVDETYDMLNVENIDKAIINMGNDKDNINLAFHMIDRYINNNDTHPLRLIVRIEDKELDTLFTSNSIFKNQALQNSKIEVKSYSFFKECAAKLFQDNFIDGDDDRIIKLKEEYSIAILGDGRLAKQVIYEAGKIAYLPNENNLNIYLVSSNPAVFKKSLLRNYSNLEKIPTLKLHECPLDYRSFEYYEVGENSIWETENLTNVIVCYDDEDINLEIASSIQNKIFLRKETTTTKVLFGIFNQKYISAQVDSNENDFKNFKSFGNAKEILSVENVFEDENYKLAKLINYTYDGLLENGKYDKDALFNNASEKIDHTWFKASNSDRESSLAQARHIKMKLKTLDLYYKKSDLSREDLLKHNRNIIDSKFDIEFKGEYAFPEQFDDTLFHKMIRLEHNRWNAYHYLNGWEYKEYENKKEIKAKYKALKKHNCLLPLKDFSQKFTDRDELVTLIEWDIYALMYIPNYLAEAGYIIKNKKKEV